MTSGYQHLDVLPMAVYLTDAEGNITYYNDAAAEFWGGRPQIGSARWCGPWRLFWPDGRPLAHEDCPMAVALKEGRPVRGVEAMAERPDGTRVRFIPYPTPLRDADGRMTGALNLLVDINDRQHFELEAARLASIVTSSDDAIISKTLEGRVTSWNAGAKRIFGYDAAEMIGQSITRIIPPELHDEETYILGQIAQGKRVEHYETVRVGKDGRRIDISLTSSPLRDRTGRVVGASKIARDVTERKQAEKIQQILINELNHRVKNTLAMVQAIATQSLRRAKSNDEFVTSFTGRIQALTSAHTMLTRNLMHGTDINEIVRDQVLLGTDDERIACSGPSLTLDAQSALHLSLVLHELGTNARKYGALSTPQGRLLIDWEMTTNGGRQLQLRWTERGGPSVSAPATHGFGATLIEQSLRAHGGEAVVRYEASGVSCEISLPLHETEPHGSRAVETTAPDAMVAAMLASRGAAPAPRSRRVIIVEDEPLLLMDLEANLEDAGCQVIGSAGTVPKARQLIEQGGFDLALLDANLDGHPVDDLAAALTRRGIPFVFVTGYGRDALPAAFRDAPLVSKPVSLDHLLAAVEQLSRRSSADVVQLRPGAA